MIELEDVQWRKSTFSADQGDCVEVAPLADDRIGVRDSKHPDGVITFARREMNAWLKRVKAGEFDDLA